MPSVSISGQHNITFLQIPKNAGTSIGHWLIKNKGESKETIWYNHPKMSDINSKNFTFTVVRNPWDRMVSMYFFLKNWTNPMPNSKYDKNSYSSERLRILNGYDSNFFPEFDEWILKTDSFKLSPWLKWNINMQQTSWIDRPVDLIIRYEKLNESFEKIQNIMNISEPLPIELSTLNVYRTYYKDYYTNKTQDIVYELFKHDITQLNYEF
jgi:hypothetical protein